MTANSSDPTENAIRSAAELDVALTEMLREALDNGVDVGGSWVVRNGDGTPDWEVLITQLATEE